MFSFKHFEFLGLWTVLNTSSIILSFCFFIFVASIFVVASALGLKPEYPSVLFTLELLENPFLMQTAFRAMIGCKIPLILFLFKLCNLEYKI